MSDDIYHPFADVRIDKLFWLPAVFACSTPPDDVREMLEDLDYDEPAVRDLPILRSILQLIENEGLCDLEAAYELAAMLCNENTDGFIFQAATPVTSEHRSSGYTFSWGHFRTSWFYAPNLAVVQSIATAWAERCIETDRRKSISSMEAKP